VFNLKSPGYPKIYPGDWGLILRAVKLFKCNRSQAVRIPKEFQFSASEVFMRREGCEVILSARPADWVGFLASDLVASSGFMLGVVDLPVRERVDR
jgi:antitoxin VapB